MKGTVYVSEALMYFDTLSLERLAAESAASNFDRGITGYLYFEKDRFVQYIEGDDDAVDALMDAIARDRRHRVLHTVVERGIDERRFPSWHMRKVARAELLEVKLEDVLSDYLLHLDAVDARRSERSDRWENLVWGMVNRLSTVRGRLDAY